MTAQAIRFDDHRLEAARIEMRAQMAPAALPIGADPEVQQELHTA